MIVSFWEFAIFKCELLVSGRVQGVIPPSFSPHLHPFFDAICRAEITPFMSLRDPFLGGKSNLLYLANFTLVVACFGLVSYNGSPASEQLDHGLNEGIKYSFSLWLCKKYSLKPTWHLKMDGWEITFFQGLCYFQGG